MDIKAYTQGVLRTEGSKEPKELSVRVWRLLHSAMGMATEAGEIVDQLKRHIFYGAPLDEDNLIEEYGDTFWYSTQGLSALSSSVEDAMARNNAKLATRYPDGFTEFHAVTRDLKKERETLEPGMKLVYLAHPLTGDGSEKWGHMDKNFERYMGIVAKVSNSGYAVSSWAHHYLMAAWRLSQGNSEFYLERDFALLDRSDEVFICGPPSVSTGTQREIERSQMRCIPVRTLNLVGEGGFEVSEALKEDELQDWIAGGYSWPYEP